ncbi:MAG: OmpA family protein [Dysgonomonas sp.]|uniref:OmpA/MotB family protein n=1 Tax=unclassified Dysgonomonas TaxID=2630389 RepID=UPI0025BBFF04|nr:MULTISPECIES: OmpA family protein [unclassified Dysgonomonas]MDR1717965.1 OmpA family protein [Prevotella sp.]MDR2002114.1 OmpA family protein [Prevotella sp.]HMM04959.1 OmpA family protein [Dysgonomonas sp.]
MRHFIWTLLILTASILFTSCVSKSKFRNLEADYNLLKNDYQEGQLQLRESNTRVASLEDRLREAQQNNADLRAAYAELQNSLNKSLAQSSQGNVNIAKLLDEINASNRFIQHLVEAKNKSDSLNLVMVNNLTRSLSRSEMQDLDIKVLKGVVYISLSDNMLYRSGSYEISEKAGEILSKIAKIILDYKDYDVLVEGNTDTDPISRPNIRNNWDLSTLRASSVVQALQNNYGVDPKRMTAGGRGEYNPVASNSTVEGKALNRRTQIIITPKLDQFMELIDQAPESSLDADY